MNHDYAHCLDYSKDCPKKCFRGELVRDLQERTDLVGIPLTWANLEGTQYCEKTKKDKK